MERMWIRGVNRLKAAEMLFSSKEGFSVDTYRKYDELEIVVQDDGRYSVWGNFRDDSDLLQENCVRKLLVLADEISTEE